MIRLPTNILKILDIRTQNLPVESSILNPNLAMSFLSQMLGNLTAASKLYQLEVSLVNDVLHGLVAAVDEVHILGRHAACSGEMEKLLHDY